MNGSVAPADMKENKTSQREVDGAIKTETGMADVRGQIVSLSFLATTAAVALAILALPMRAHAAETPILPAKDAAPRLRIERTPVAGGAEIDTLIRALPNGGGDFPLVSILVDTLGDSDPTNDSLRKVWVLSYARPTILQRVVAGLPFVYIKAGSPPRRENSTPAAILDMRSNGGGTWFKVAHAITQAEVLDPLGMPVRASTRAYSGNVEDFRNEHVWQALSALSAADREDIDGALSHEELERVQARLLLSTRMFGDLVSDSYLPRAFEKERSAQIEFRERNWELLRQRAEEDNLYFEPLTLAFGETAQALLWVERRPHSVNEQTAFNGQFLGIGNPFEGNWLEKWKGYTEQWTLDADGARVEPGTPGSHAAEMVPLALYSLDYPKAPLLLVDFRQPFKAKRREMVKRAADQAATGILGLTTFGNLEYFAAKETWMFVRTRHGAATDREARLRAYSQFRHSLFFDESLDPKLRGELSRRASGLGLNPFEDSMATEAQLARDQYAALRAYAAAPDGLAKKLARARSAEVAGLLHTKGQLFWYRTASIATLGIYRHTDPMTPQLLADVDLQRRFAWNKRFLEQVIGSTPKAEVAYNMEQVQRSLDAIAEIGQQNAEYRQSSEQLVRRVLSQTLDADMRKRCTECLQRLGSGAPPKSQGAAVALVEDEQ